MNVLVSIIIPIYNVEKYLAECLQSVINQTYSNIEIILVNDGSTDNSEKICLNYIKLDKRIKYYYKKNGGLSSSRNYGLTKSHGSYICFIDSDDFIDNNYIEKLLLFTIKNNCEITICSETCFDDFQNKRKYLKKFSSDKRGNRVINEVDIWDEFYFYRKGGDVGYSIVTAYAKIYKRDILNNFRFKKTLCEDQFAATILFSKTKRIGIIDDALYFYRENRCDSIMFNLKKNPQMISAFEYKINIERIKHFIKCNYPTHLIIISYKSIIYQFRRISKTKKLFYISRHLFLLIKLKRFDINTNNDIKILIKHILLAPFYLLKKSQRQ